MSSQAPQRADVGEFITDLDGSIFDQQLSVIIAQVANSVIDLEKKGDITIKLSFSKMGASNLLVHHENKNSHAHHPRRQGRNH